jgi:hypothetical protein
LSNSMISNNIDQFQHLFDRISSIIEEAKYKIAYSIDNTMVQSYWRIGKEIIEEEQKGQLRAEYGKSIIDNLAKNLSKKYGKGFSTRNLWMIRQFYSTYPNLNALRAELSWTHYRLIMQIDDPAKRSFYEIECADSELLPLKDRSFLLHRFSIEITQAGFNSRNSCGTSTFYDHR